MPPKLLVFPAVNEKQLYRMRAPASGREAIAHAEPGTDLRRPRDRRGDGAGGDGPAARPLRLRPPPHAGQPPRLPPLRPADRPRRQRLPYCGLRQSAALEPAQAQREPLTTASRCRAAARSSSSSRRSWFCRRPAAGGRPGCLLGGAVLGQAAAAPGVVAGDVEGEHRRPGRDREGDHLALEDGQRVVEGEDRVAAEVGVEDLQRALADEGVFGRLRVFDRAQDADPGLRGPAEEVVEEADLVGGRVGLGASRAWPG